MAATSSPQVPASIESLYEQTIASEPHLKPIPASPILFKSLLDSALTLLDEQQIVATLWVKLPITPIWQTCLQRYCHSQQSSRIYTLTSVTPNPAVEPSSELELTGPTGCLEEAENGEGDGDGNQAIPMQVIPLLNNAYLREEYFLLVVSERWCSLVLAHRPRSTPVQEADPKHYTPSLLMISSVQSSTIATVLANLQQGLASADLAGVVSQPIPAIDWEEQFTTSQQWVGDAELMACWFAHHLRQQQQIWQQFSHLQRQETSLAALRSQNEHLMQALHRKDEFLNTVGQELRTPLTNMKTALSLLNSPQLKPSQRQRYMQMLGTECDRQSSLITSMLNLVQLDTDIEQDSFHPINLADIIPGVVSTYQPLAQEKGIMLAYTIPDHLPPILCLDNWVRQIAVHLLHNSIKFTHANGKAWVRAKQQGDYVQLEFQDTGIGIPVQEIPKIFDRFYRVRNTNVEDTTGVGLGLTIVQQILLRCGGSISVKSKVGSGSTFNVLLPIVVEASSPDTTL